MSNLKNSRVQIGAGAKAIDLIRGLTFVRLVPAAFGTTLEYMRGVRREHAASLILKPTDILSGLNGFWRDKGQAFAARRAFLVHDLAEIARLFGEAEDATSLQMDFYVDFDPLQPFSPHQGLRLIYTTVESEEGWAILRVDGRKAKLDRNALFIDVSVLTSTKTTRTRQDGGELVFLARLEDYKRSLSEPEYAGASEISPQFVAKIIDLEFLMPDQDSKDAAALREAEEGESLESDETDETGSESEGVEPSEPSEEDLEEEPEEGLADGVEEGLGLEGLEKEIEADEAEATETEEKGEATETNSEESEKTEEAEGGEPDLETLEVQEASEDGGAELEQPENEDAELETGESETETEASETEGAEVENAEGAEPAEKAENGEAEEASETEAPEAPGQPESEGAEQETAESDTETEAFENEKPEVEDAEGAEPAEKAEKGETEEAGETEAPEAQEQPESEGAEQETGESETETEASETERPEAEGAEPSEEAEKGEAEEDKETEAPEPPEQLESEGAEEETGETETEAGASETESPEAEGPEPSEEAEKGEAEEDKETEAPEPQEQPESEGAEEETGESETETEASENERPEADGAEPSEEAEKGEAEEDKETEAPEPPEQLESEDAEQETAESETETEASETERPEAEGPEPSEEAEKGEVEEDKETEAPEPPEQLESEGAEEETGESETETEAFENEKPEVEDAEGAEPAEKAEKGATEEAGGTEAPEAPEQLESEDAEQETAESETETEASENEKPKVEDAEGAEPAEKAEKGETEEDKETEAPEAHKRPEPESAEKEANRADAEVETSEGEHPEEGDREGLEARREADEADTIEPPEFSEHSGIVREIEKEAELPETTETLENEKREETKSRASEEASEVNAAKDAPDREETKSEAESDNPLPQLEEVGAIETEGNRTPEKSRPLDADEPTRRAGGDASDAPQETHAPRKPLASNILDEKGLREEPANSQAKNPDLTVEGSGPKLETSGVEESQSVERELPTPSDEGTKHDDERNVIDGKAKDTNKEPLRSVTVEKYERNENRISLDGFQRQFETTAHKIEAKAKVVGPEDQSENRAPLGGATDISETPLVGGGSELVERAAFEKAARKVDHHPEKEDDLILRRSDDPGNKERDQISLKITGDISEKGRFTLDPSDTFDAAISSEHEGTSLRADRLTPSDLPHSAGHRIAPGQYHDLTEINERFDVRHTPSTSYHVPVAATDALAPDVTARLHSIMTSSTPHAVDFNLRNNANYNDPLYRAVYSIDTDPVHDVTSALLTNMRAEKLPYEGSINVRYPNMNHSFYQMFVNVPPPSLAPLVE